MSASATTQETGQYNSLNPTPPIWQAGSGWVSLSEAGFSLRHLEPKNKPWVSVAQRWNFGVQLWPGISFLWVPTLFGWFFKGTPKGEHPFCERPIPKQRHALLVGILQASAFSH